MILLAIAGSALGYAAVPSFRDTVNAKALAGVHDIERPFCVGSIVPVRPGKVSTSAALPGHPAADLTDLINSDYWAADSAAQPVINLTFPAATDLDFLLVTTGAADEYAKLARPKDIRVSYGSGTQEELQLKDDPKTSCYSLHGKHETAVAIRILSVYPSPQSSAVAIAELELFRLS